MHKLNSKISEIDVSRSIHEYYIFVKLCLLHITCMQLYPCIENKAFYISFGTSNVWSSLVKINNLYD